MKRLLYFLLALALIIPTGCAIDDADGDMNTKAYSSYRQIPGVTDEEIAALEDLLERRPDLIYGTCISTEAFLYEDGSMGGFDILLCERLSELLGFNFEYEICTWNELADKVSSGEVDLSTDFSSGISRSKDLLTTDPIIQRSIKLFTDKDNASLADIAKTRPVVCAFLEGREIYSKVAETWDIEFTPVFITDRNEVVDLFLSGSIDAFIEEGELEAVFQHHDMIKAEDYYPITYMPAALVTGNRELQPLIDVMQKYLDSGGAKELSELYNEGEQDYYRYEFTTRLSEEEKQYILAHNSEETAVKMAFETGNYPSSFYNRRDKEFQGVAIDVMRQVTELTGLEFVVANGTGDEWSELLQGLEKGEFSMISELIMTSQRKDHFLWADEPCFEDKYAMLSRIDFPDIDINQVLFCKVGLLKDKGYTDAFYEWFPQTVQTVTYESTDKAFMALESGEIDLLMASQNVLLHLTNYLEKPHYKANITFDYASDSFFGFNENEQILRNVISEAMMYVDVDEIVNRWEQKSFDYQSKLIRDMAPYFLVLFVILVAALIGVLYLMNKNKSINKNLEKLVEERTNELGLQTSMLRTIFESIPDIIFCKNLDLKFTRCNRSFEEHFDCKQEDIVGKDDTQALGVPFDVAERYRESDRKVISDRKRIVIEEIIPSSDGTFPLFETIKMPLIQDGEPIGLVGIARDITQRKATAETLQLTLDNLDTCIYITEIDTGKVLFINEKMKKEFGIGDFTGEICWKVLQKGFTERCEFCPVPKLLQSNDDYYVWEEHNTVTGKYYKNTDSLIKWHDGKLVHMQHAVEITESVKLQRELEHASKAKSDFLSRMSHEIRTPLNAIIGMNSIAINSEDMSKIRHSQERIDNASKHLLGLINDILDMSKIEADKFELSLNEFDFEKMLMNIASVVNFRADEKHQNIVVQLNKNVPVILVSDELRLSQVITNLLTNAVKFTPENGTIVLSIDLDRDADEQSVQDEGREDGRDADGESGQEITLRIEVADNGIGISEEQKSRLFTSFEQADGSISRKFGGTGLGLAISKRIVELMGGKIWIESELGKGSKFIFKIKAQKGKKTKPVSVSRKINREDIRILAVDDCVETREYFAHVMTAHNLPFDVAESGPDAIDKIENCEGKPYNIFFVDWQMPEMNGVELTRRIKEMTHGNSVVIMISVADWNDIESEAIAAGVKQFIPKPLFPSVLINTVNECIGAEAQYEKAKSEQGFSDMKGKFKNNSILIAEDVDVNREIAAAILEDTEISIDFAEDGRMAVLRFKEQPSKYDLILMDIHMPEMDGYEATRLIRDIGSPKAKEIPIIAMTANVFREDIENCLAAGMNDHIGKPIDSNVLMEKLEHYLPK